MRTSSSNFHLLKQFECQLYVNGDSLKLLSFSEMLMLILINERETAVFSHMETTCS